MGASVAQPESFDAGRPMLEELTDGPALAELVRGVHSLFRLPVSVYSEAALLVRAPQSSEFYSWLLSHRELAQRTEGFIHQLQHCDLGASGECLLHCFTGASFQAALVGHEGRRLGRVVVGPFVEIGAPADALAPRLSLGAQGTELFGKLPRLQAGSARAIARHVVRTISALLHAGYRAWLVERAHLSALHESDRERTQHREQLKGVRLQLSERDRGGYGLLISACQGLSVSADALRAGLDSLRHLESPPGAEMAAGLSTLLSALEQRLSSLETVARAVAEEPRRVSVSVLRRLLSTELGPLAAGAELRLELDIAQEEFGATMPSSLPSALSAFCRSLLGGLSPGSRLCVRVTTERAGLALLGGESPDLEVRVLAEGVERPLTCQYPGVTSESLRGTELTLLEALVQGQGGRLDRLDEPGLLWAWRLWLPGRAPSTSESAA